MRHHTPSKNTADYLGCFLMSADPLHHAVIDRAIDKAVGTLVLMRIDRANANALTELRGVDDKITFL
ncbi:hypothetical protein PQQ53_19585 [Paraburkholderia strydomiana]|jgi:hypothetical protein|uniref:Uncharacterized protein n=1 Tax=Paraburkholderia strydomiana TaxID=1245417 RepID=A0ABW9ENK1_9BURK